MADRLSNGAKLTNGAQSLGAIPSLLMRGGKLGGAGIMVAALGKLAKFIFPHLPDIDDLVQFFLWIGVGLGVMGLSAQTSRGTDMQATVAAEAKIDRAVIANAVTPPEVVILPMSDDPAVQNEIDRRMSGPRGTIA
jgi:hypothetical protein